MAKLAGYFATSRPNKDYVMDVIGFTVGPKVNRLKLENMLHESGFMFDLITSDKPFSYEGKSTVIYAYSDFEEELERRGIHVEVVF